MNITPVVGFRLLWVEMTEVVKLTPGSSASRVWGAGFTGDTGSGNDRLVHWLILASQRKGRLQG